MAVVNLKEIEGTRLKGMLYRGKHQLPFKGTVQ